MSRIFFTFSFLLLYAINGIASVCSPSGNPGPDSVDVHHYTVNLEVTNIAGRLLSGKTSLLFSPEFPGVTMLPLDLLAMEVDSVELDGDHTPFLYNDTTILLTLPDSLTGGDTLTATVYYHGIPVVETGGWGGFHFSGNSLAYNLGVALVDTPHTYGKVWHPCIDRFDEKASYDFFITVNDPLVAVCNGILTDTAHPEPGKVVYHWKLEQPIPAYLASVAVSAYALVGGEYLLSPPDTIPTCLYVRPQDTLKARQSFANLDQILHHFILRFGPYRWPRAGFTGTPLGAMEHATSISYPNASINGTLNDEWLYAHELAHSWFGNLVTCKDAGDMWINEGWAVWAEGVYKEGLYGGQEAKRYLRAKHHDVLKTTHHADGGFFALAGIPSALTYGSTVYDKGCMVVNSLRGYLGDSVFFDIVKQYTDSFAFKNISSEGLRDFFSARSGTDLTDFFDTWVFHPGFPHFSIDSFTVLPNGGMYDVTVFIRQKMKGTTHISNSNRLEIYLGNSILTGVMDTLIFSGTHAQRTFHVPFHPTMVSLDPLEKISDATTDERIVVASPDPVDFPEMYCRVEATQCPDTNILRVVHNWVAPDPLPVPVPGFRISPQRYWTVEGTFSTGFKAKASFKYSRFGFLDHELIDDPEDSLVLLYRPSAAWPWQGIPFTMDGAAVLGELVIDSLMRGEYTLGIWDHTFLSVPEKQTESNCRVFPNPSRDKISLQLSLDRPATISFTDVSGKFLDSLSMERGTHNLNWEPPQRKPGLYFISVREKGRKKNHTIKAVLLP